MILILKIALPLPLFYFLHFSNNKCARIEVGLLHEGADGAIYLVPRLLQHPVDVHVGARDVVGGGCGGLETRLRHALVFLRNYALVNWVTRFFILFFLFHQQLFLYLVLLLEIRNTYWGHRQFGMLLQGGHFFDSVNKLFFLLLRQPQINAFFFSMLPCHLVEGAWALGECSESGSHVSAPKPQTVLLEFLDDGQEGFLLDLHRFDQSRHVLVSLRWLSARIVLVLCHGFCEKAVGETELFLWLLLTYLEWAFIWTIVTILIRSVF